MKRQLQFITLLFEDLKENVTLYIANGGDGLNANYLNKNHSKTALKRKNHHAAAGAAKSGKDD